MDQIAYVEQLESLVEDLSSKLAALESLEEWRSKRIGRRIHYHYIIQYTHKFDQSINKHIISRVSAMNIIRSYRQKPNLHDAIESEGKYRYILENARSIGLYIKPSRREIVNIGRGMKTLEFIIDDDLPEMKLLCEWNTHATAD